MSKLPIAFVAAIAFAGAAHAQEATYQPLASYTMGSVARADVHAQAVAAVESGTVAFGEASRFPAPSAGSVVSRAVVQAEAREALRRGVLRGGEVTVLPSAADIQAFIAIRQRADDAQMAAR